MERTSSQPNNKSAHPFNIQQRYKIKCLFWAFVTCTCTISKVNQGSATIWNVILSSKSEEQDLVSKQFSFQSSLFHSSSSSVQKMILFFEMQNHQQPPCVLCSMCFGALQYIRLLFTLVCFACSQIEIEFNLYFMYTHNKSIESRNTTTR